MHTELLVSRVGRQVWAALREDGVVVELRLERTGCPTRAGRVLKARVSNVVPAIQSAFLDVGASRDAFLHVSDLLLPGETPPATRRRVEAGNGFHAAAEMASNGDPSPEMEPAPIEDRLKVGRELLVQVVRESPEYKGDRVSCYVGLPGRLLVLLPMSRHGGVSRRIEDPAERERLAACLEQLAGGTVGFVARTAARGAPASALEAEASRLMDTWRGIRKRAESARAPAVLYEEPPLPLPLLRDAPQEGFDRVVMDDRADRAQALAYLQRVDPVLCSRIDLYEGTRAMLEDFGLHQDIERAVRPRVWLRSGGYVVIEQTEALVSVDVNTGKSVRGRQQERTILETNLEAAAEIARQLRLRDLGGIIVIDFIDMALRASRRRVVQAFETALRKDSARTKIVGLSELGLLQLTRKRSRAGVSAAVTRACPLCGGQGQLKRPEIVAGEAIAELMRKATASGATRFSLRAHPEVIRAIKADLGGSSASPIPDKALSLNEDPRLDPDRFVVE
jgi:ribonuclease G